jgi:hypothetical protein
LELAEDMARTLDYVQDVEQFARIRQFVETIKEVQTLLGDAQNFIIKHCSHNELGTLALLPMSFWEHNLSLLNALLSVGSSKNLQIDDLRFRFERFQRQFDRGLAIQMAVTLESLISKLSLPSICDQYLTQIA